MKRLGYILLLLLLLSSCGKEAAPQAVYLIPQIVSTEVVPTAETVTLYASITGPAHFTGCGFGIIQDGLIREYPSVLDDMSFSLTADGLSADSEYSFYAFIANGTSRIQTPPRSFRTLQKDPDPNAPTVRFTEVEAIPGTGSVLLSAELSEADDITSAGFSLSADGHEYQTFESSRTGRSFSLTVEDLSPDTEYHYYAWAVQREVLVSSNPTSFRTQKEVHEAVFLSLSAAAEAFSVTLQADLSDGHYVEACGFGLAQAGRSAVEYGASLEENSFTMKVDGLQPSTEYIWYAFFLMDGVRTTSEFARFTTQEDPTLRISDLHARADIYSVRLEAALSHTEGVLSCGFALAEEESSFIRHAVQPQENGYFSLEIDGLTPETDYLFYAWAVTEEGEVLSETLRFTTRQAPHGEISFVSIAAESGKRSARLKAVLTKTDGISECGFGVSTNTHDFIEYTASLEGDGFLADIGGLMPATQYYFYAYFVLDGKTFQSELYNFTTDYE